MSLLPVQGRMFIILTRCTIYDFLVFVVGLIKWYLKSIVSRKFYSYFEHEKITPLNLRLSLVLFLSKLLDNGREKHFAEVINSRHNV